MAILPLKTALGTVLPTATRAPAVADTTAIGRGVAQLGQGLQAAGTDLDYLAKKQLHEQNIVQDANQSAGYLQDREQARLQITADGDYATQTQRFQEANKALITKYGAGISDPRARAIWIAHNQESSVAAQSAVEVGAASGLKQIRGVQLKGNLEKYAGIIADPRTDDVTRKQALANAQATIDAAKNEGVITPEGAQQWTTSYVQGGKLQLRATQVETKDGNAAVAPPVASGSREQHGMQTLQGEGLSNVAAAGILGTLAGESRDYNPNSINPHDGKDGSDSIGIGQWNSGRAVALKAFAASRGKPWNDLDTQLAFITHEMKTDYPRVWAKLQTVRTAEEAAGIVTTEYTMPKGSQSGPAAAAGWAARRDKAIRLAGGKFEPGSGGATPDPYLYTYGKIRDQNPDFTPQQVEYLTQRAISARNRFNVEDRASLDGVVQDAPAAIQATGSYSGQIPTQQQFTDAYGPQDGAQKYATFQASMGVSQTVHDMLTMPAADIQATVNAAQSTNSGPGAALALQKAETIQKAAESTLKAREADPASYTLQAFPSIKQAWADAQQSHDFAGALRMTSAAQTQLGIPADKQALVPKGMAEDIVKAGKDETKTPADRLNAISGLVLATSDRGQRQAILQQLVKAGLPASIDRSLDAAARGDTAGAQLLFAAATVDPNKLPGEIEAGGWFGSSGTKIKSGDIETRIQTDVLAPGKIGDAVYGINDGNIDNLQLAQNDGVLLKNGVKLEMLHNGGDLGAAIQRVSKAVYGDLKVVNDGQVSVAAPIGVDEKQLVDGLMAQKEAARQELSRFGLVNEAKTPEEKQIARFAGMDKDRHIQTILDNGVWRNVGDGYGLLDKASGLFVAGPDGKPFVVTADQALKAAVAQTGADATTPAPTPGQYNEMKRGGPGGRFRANFDQTPAFGAPAAAAPDIPAAAQPVAAPEPPQPPQLPPQAQGETPEIQRAIKIRRDELRTKAGLGRAYQGDIP